ncbi:YMR003W [Saccharomyces arboricola H-6]|uniref:Altered inheritance of mitochondria protein 34, mitochondrial n=1 Tax=Saccharomyces arboricola (strain H-6 / AS 2.3317 / CBS 10644) TaxID=1160507 RepID=J8PYI0_SACAR|nr:YMR003W [Saccharomyces arboricola H-6]
MSFPLLGKYISRKFLGIPTFGPGRSVSLPYALLLMQSGVLNLDVHRYVHSTQTKSHLTFILNNNDTAPFQKFTVKVLKEQCKSRGLKLSGRKSDLLQRLITYDSCSHMKRTVKVPNELRRSSLMDESIKVNKLLLSNKNPKTIDKKHFSVQKTSNIQPPCEVHPHLQPRDKIFLVGFAMLLCLWWNLELKESEPTNEH